MHDEINVGVVIGRFQPLHICHLSEAILPALDESDTLIILLGSSHRPSTPKNPWTDSDRAEMIHLGLKDAGMTVEAYGNWLLKIGASDTTQKTVYIVPIRDFAYSDIQWQMQVQEKVREIVSSCSNLDSKYESAKINLFGVDRDDTTFYLKLFPQWIDKTTKRDKSSDQVKGTMCRELIFASGAKGHGEWGKYLSPQVSEFILNWCNSISFSSLKEEFDFLKRYKADLSGYKYPIIFQTVDNIILYKGHVFLLNRRSFPGKGLLSLPGGFIDSSLTLLQSALSIAKEKSKLNLKLDWLVASKTFDYPGRSLRGRTITTAFLWKLPETMNVIVAGANKEHWYQLCDIMKMSDFLYEDHYDIIIDMLQLSKT
jgi:bifunctional NMN adenylyltransferase/nudix hydrolase